VEGAPRRATGQDWKSGAWPGRTFAMLVMVPVLLMLGSVYLHTMAVGLKGESVRLEEEKTRAEGGGERLEVQLTKLSEPGRIRDLARKYLQMRDPSGQDLETYNGSYGEDVVNGGGEKNEGRSE
jgi:cell division protein FtsL